MKHENHTFSNEDVHLDGNEFRHCTFDHCKIIFSGKELCTLFDCTFDSCNWRFADAAERTLDFMTMMYAGGGAYKTVIQGIFDHIRNQAKIIARPRTN